MNFFTIVSLLGGLAMFLYGMEVMGAGLKNASGSTLKNVLGKATHNVILGVITGMLVTAVIQSSTATIVLTVGLISAGILNLKQAVSIVMGANIGTTITAQIIRLMDLNAEGNFILSLFQPSTLAPLAMILGIILIMFVKSARSNTIGEIAMGFGILFSGLLNMTSAVEPLAESESFKQALQSVGDRPMLALLLGLAVTVVVQSSSATVGMIQALSVTGVMTFRMVYPMIMGINLGTCVTTAMVCSIGSSKDAKRTGVVHIAFNVIGTILFMTVMTIIRRLGFLPDLWDSVVHSGGIANFQTLFNLVTAIVLIPFSQALVNLSMHIVKPDAKDAESQADLMVPDEKLYEVPAMALAESVKAITKMGRAALRNLTTSCKLLTVYDKSRLSVVSDIEDQIDQFTDAMDSYLVDLAPHVETEQDSQTINMLMQSSTNFERIGDHAVNIMESAQMIEAEHVSFSQEAREELDVIREAVTEITEITLQAFERQDNQEARRIEPLEDVIDDMVLTLKDRHIERLKAGSCTTTSGVVFVDILTNLERVADQCSNVALLILSQQDKSIMGNHHGYVRELHKGGDVVYETELAKRQAQYLARILPDGAGADGTGDMQMGFMDKLGQ